MSGSKKIAASALAAKIKLDELSALLDEMLAETGGPLTPAERRAADRALGVQATSESVGSGSRLDAQRSFAAP